MNGLNDKKEPFDRSLSIGMQGDNMDLFSFLLFFFVVVPLVLLNLHNIQKREKEILDLLKETNRLLIEVTNDKRP